VTTTLLLEAVAPVLFRMSSTEVWVAGDLMLDEYLEGRVARVSPEAPVPVVDVRSEYQRLGGAAHVADCIAQLGARASLAGLVGDDPAGAAILAACAQRRIDAGAVERVPGWMTTRKVRVIAQQQQVVRLDWGGVAPDGGPHFSAGLARWSRRPRPGALVVSDYAKGYLSDACLDALRDVARAHQVPLVVDPKRSDWSTYAGATVITPNLGELEAASRAEVALDQVPEVARQLAQRHAIAAAVVTLGDRGIWVVPVDGEATHLPALARDVFDVTGAGDVVVALLAVCLASGADLALATSIANIAAGISVTRVGTSTITLSELAAALPVVTGDKVVAREALAMRVAFWRLCGRRVVFTNGCFDLLHPGHLALLEFAAQQGDVLVVGLNHDASVARLKGPDRPAQPFDERAAVLASLGCVAAVVGFDEETPLALIEEILPDVLVKGADYALDDVVGGRAVARAGGRVILAPLLPGHSTTRRLERLRARGVPTGR
jgi:D-beta-D-heptose 7-phosphate kinase / D-beta-D-heptose 1-phosphate adenosyltransferase